MSSTISTATKIKCSTSYERHISKDRDDEDLCPVCQIAVAWHDRESIRAAGQPVFTVGQELMKKREYFSELVLNSGVAPPSNIMEKKKFDYVMDKKIIVRVSDTFKRVHDLGYVFNDLKPDNIYMDSNGDIDIGDFGGVTEIGKAFLEITEEYIPADL
eukprot:gene44599-59515_t